MHSTQSTRRPLFNWAMAAVLLAGTAVPGLVSANTTNAVPYVENFEDPAYTNGFYIVGTNGWYGKDEILASPQVMTNNYDNLFFGQRPLPDTVTHAKILKLNESATNQISHNGSADPKVWVDMMLQPKRWEQEDHPSVPDDADMALYFSSNGQIVAYCRTFDGTNVTTNATWLTMDNAVIGSNDWIRLTVVMWYRADAQFDYFQIVLNNSQPVTHLKGVGEPTGVDYDDSHFYTNNGSWFIATEQTVGNMKALAFNGTGYLDDLVVTNGPVDLSTPRTVVVTFDKGAVVVPNGNVAVRDTGGAIFVISAQIGYDITDVAWGWDTPTNSVGVTNQLELSNITTDHVVHVSASPEMRRLIVQNVGDIGTPTPDGTNLYAFDSVITAYIADVAVEAINTSTTRHYSTWTRTVSQAGTGNNQTSTVFTIKGDATNSDTVLTWNWRLQHVLNTYTMGPVGFIPGTDGSVDVAETTWWDAGVTTAPITASAVGNWQFTGWSGTTNGSTVNVNTQLLANMDGPRTNVMANFIYNAASTSWTLTVDSTYDMVVPATGTHQIADGTVTNCVATNDTVLVLSNDTRAVLTGWTGLGRVPASGTTTNTGLFMMTQDSGITWNWATQYWLDSGAGVGGTVNKPDAWYTNGVEVSILATVTNAGMEFDQWTGGGVPAGAEFDNPLVVTMDQARVVMATFNQIAQVGQYGSPATFYEQYPALYSGDVNVAETQDWDMDLLLNWEEWATGTDVTNPDSYFSVIDQRTFPASNCVRFLGTTNYGVTNYFGMYRSTNLMNPAWDLIITDTIPRAVDGTNVWYDLTPPAGRAYYRPMLMWTNN